MRRLLGGVLCMLCVTLAFGAAPLRDDVSFFIANMMERHGMDGEHLRTLFAELKPVASIAKAVSAPSTSRPWHEYRPLFVDKGRIEGGVQFWRRHEALLARAQDTYGVPADIIVAIVGVETRYGKFAGKHRVIDALYTLGFEVPGRNEFFKSELEAFLLLTREQGWDPLSIKGSYAGAMGVPQFMPSSYRKFAVDFDDDGKADLWTNPADVIGSVANFLSQSGWRKDEIVVLPARVEGADVQTLLSLGIKPHSPLQQLKLQGVQPEGEVDDQLLAALFSLDIASGQEYWLSFQNFNVILQYNRSRNYAMSVYQLAREIARERERLGVSEPNRPICGNEAVQDCRAAAFNL